MATRRVIKSVLRNFLETFASRYTDYGGYWLFGFLVNDLDEWEFNLLSPGASDMESPRAAAEKKAATKFHDQVRKSGLDRSLIRDALLTIKKLPDVQTGSINGHPTSGHRICFRANVQMDNERRYACEYGVFAAPHNPQVELRSAGRGPN
jgi:hypothetical protein